MQREESPYPDDWLRLAERDMSGVGRLLSMEDSEAAGFFLQQAGTKNGHSEPAGEESGVGLCSWHA